VVKEGGGEDITDYQFPGVDMWKGIKKDRIDTEK